ncbi:MAG: RelA/SpoT domain-containing protein [Clostridia bacterium]|nr:RelA/SpoT domain-containing protein [Clostridia bacterium]
MELKAIRPKWKTVEHSRSEIIRAGKIIRNEFSTEKEIKEATEVIDNWRASHAFPLHIFYNNLRRYASAENGFVVAERLKRLDSIIKKLKRLPRMNLWEMQDLGGCRLIVPSIEDVYFVSNKFKDSRIRHTLKRVHDYIQEPQTSGYRSLHLVYEYHSDTVETYNRNMQIEIQFRTHLQHLWATAVETMGLFTKTALKAGQGEEDVKRFFLLCSAVFASIEQQPLPPNVCDDIDVIRDEIRNLNAKHKYLEFLSGIRVAVDAREKSEKKIKRGYCILILNYEHKRLRIKYFKPSEIEDANRVYDEIESSRAEDRIDAVMVRVSSFNELKTAYPNYFSDIGEFIGIVQKFM